MIMKKRRYFVAYNHLLGNGHAHFIVKDKFDISEVIKIIEKENNCLDVVLTFFKELKEYEIFKREVENGKRKEK